MCNVLASGNETTTTTPTQRIGGVEFDVGNPEWYRRFQDRPCVTLPRVLVSAYEDGTGTAGDHGAAIPPFVNASAFETLRWRYRATPRHADRNYHSANKLGKSIMDLSRISFGDIRRGKVNAHLPNLDVCPTRHKSPLYKTMPLGIFHYLGGWESYSCRDDARDGVDPARRVFSHSFDQWSAHAYARDGGVDDQVRPWIGGFVRLVGGEENAKYLLRGTGDLANCSKKEIDPEMFRLAKNRTEMKRNLEEKTNEEENV